MYAREHFHKAGPRLCTEECILTGDPETVVRMHASKPGRQERLGSSLSPHWPRQNHFWVPGSQDRLLVPETLVAVISAPTSFFTYLDQNGRFQETIRPGAGTVSPALYTRQIAAAWKPPCCSTVAPCCSTSHKVLFNHSHFAPGSSGGGDDSNM